MRSRWMGIASLAIILVSLSGCGRDERELVVSTNNWLGYMPLYAARDLQLYGDAPLRFIPLPSNTGTLRAFRDGQVNAAGVTLDEALMIAESGVQVCIPLILDYSNGADALLADSSITSLAELKGKRIGVENTAVGAHMLMRALEASGLGIGDVTVVPLEVNDHEAAFREGRVDAVVTFDPIRSRLLDEGAQQIFSSADIPGEITDVLVVQRDYLLQYPEVVSALIGGWFRVIDRLGGSDSPLVRRKLAEYGGLDADTVNRSLQLIAFPARDDNRDILANEASSFRRMVTGMNKTMVEQMVIGRQVDVADLLCPTALLPVYQ